VKGTVRVVQLKTCDRLAIKLEQCNCSVEGSWCNKLRSIKSTVLYNVYYSASSQSMISDIQRCLSTMTAGSPISHQTGCMFTLST